jgi:hypothetical protein
MTGFLSPWFFRLPPITGNRLPAQISGTDGKPSSQFSWSLTSASMNIGIHSGPQADSSINKDAVLSYYELNSRREEGTPA